MTRPDPTAAGSRLYLLGSLAGTQQPDESNHTVCTKLSAVSRLQVACFSSKANPIAPAWSIQDLAFSAHTARIAYCTWAHLPVEHPAEAAQEMPWMIAEGQRSQKIVTGQFTSDNRGSVPLDPQRQPGIMWLSGRLAVC